ncbi:MAG: GNAT family N-acetyltransferase [Actinomycetota bacterium]|nr:GNAT family N-acetyltransferase [Actinomycetota bacterium]
MIRSAETRDAADLARVHVTSWQAAYKGLVNQDFLDSLDIEARTVWWERALGREANLVSVGEIDGTIEGFCLAGASGDEGWGEVFALYVTPGHWGTGLGRDLLAAGEGALHGAGHARALLWVLDGNARARAFYQRRGWAIGKPIRIENIGGTDLTEVRYEKSLATT